MAKKVKGNCAQSQPKGKYDAPIRIVNKQDLKNYGITWKDCIRLHIGGIETVNVHMFKTDKPKLAKYFWNELNAEHHRNSRGTRCIVPGKQKPLIVCPECNKCSNCPYGKKPEDRQPRVISYECAENFIYCEVQHEPEINETEMKLDLKTIISAMICKDAEIAKVFIRYIIWGDSVAEIAASFGFPERRVRYLLKLGKGIRDKVLNR